MPVPANPARRWQPQWAFHLSKRLQAHRSHFYDPQVARRLNAVSCVLNGEGDSEMRFDAQTLVDMRSRRNRTTSKT